MGTNINNVDNLSQITNDDKVFMSDGGTLLRKTDVTTMAKYVLETYTGSSIGGSAQSTKSAIDSMSSSISSLNALAATIPTDSHIRELVGTPLVASTVSGMTDQTKIYVYTGSETGYTAGHWYYYNGSAWTDGGTYNSAGVDTDKTLSVSDKAADGKAVGDALTSLNGELTQLQSTPIIKETDDNQTDLFITDPNGNALVRFKNGHVKVKNFDSADLPNISDINDAVGLVSTAVRTVNNTTPDENGNVNVVGFYNAAKSQSTSGTNDDLDIVDENGNSIVSFVGGHVKTKNFDSSNIILDAVRTVNNTTPDENGNVNVAVIPDPDDIADAVGDYLEEHPVVPASSGIVSVADYGAVGDGTTDDSNAIQTAINNNYDVYFESNKTYYIGSTITVNHDVRLHGGNNTTIKTKTPSGGTVNNGIIASGTLKKTTTLTTDYTSSANTDNCINRFTLSDMTNISIGDIMVIVAEDQYYNYSRQYYYLGATLLITDIYDGHIYTCDVMPWNITKTNSVSVKIYSAPTIIIENLHFVSDLDSRGHYRYLVSLQQCKNSVIKNCTFTQMDNGVNVAQCVNTRIDTVQLAKSKYDNSLSGDGYGMYISSSTNTNIEKIMATCAQHSITITGTFPCINTFIKYCNLTSECRSPGLDTHESTYNLIIEDCILGVAALNGTVFVNRCKFINNRRASNNPLYISLYGSHNPDWSRIRIENSTFFNGGLTLNHAGVQNPIQAYDNVFGSVEIENCYGGMLFYDPGTNETILSNNIKNLTIKNWKGCSYIRYDGLGRIENMKIEDSSFTYKLFISDGTVAHGIVTTKIDHLTLLNAHAMTEKISVNKQGIICDSYILPENTSIQVSSSNANAKYIVCGSNLTSNSVDDYEVGTVSGSNGTSLTRTKDNNSYASLSMNGSGYPVYTQASGNSTKLSFYPVGLFYVKEPSTVQISATLKNTGSTNGATFIPMIVEVDCDSKKITYVGSGTATTATNEGNNASYSRFIESGNKAILCYFYCSTAVAASVTTFENFSITCTPIFAPVIVENTYVAHRLTGDGTIASLDGINNIMSSELSFDVSFRADFATK